MKNKLLIRKKLLQLFYCFTIMLLFANTAMGQNNIFWGNTTGDNNWATAANWSGTTRSAHSATFASGDSVITLTAVGVGGINGLALDALAGQAIVGPGIAPNTTITAISGAAAVGSTITLSTPTTAAGTASLVYIYAKSTVIPGFHNVIIENSSIPGPVISTTASAFFVSLRNTVGLNTTDNSSLTIGATGILNINSSAQNSITLAGGSIANEGQINIINTNTGASAGILCNIPTVPPTSSKTYSYSGAGTLNINISAATTANSAAINVTSLNANTTYTMSFNKLATNFTLGTTAASYAIRIAGGTAASPLIIGGTGFTLGTVAVPVRGGLLNVGVQSTVTINSGVALEMNSSPGNVTSGILLGSNTIGLPTTFTNNGVINIFGESLGSGINAGVTVSATNQDVRINIVNGGTINVDLACVTPSVTNPGGFVWSGQAAYRQAQAGFSGAGGVFFTNTGTVTLKNRSTVALTGYAIWGSGAGQRMPTSFTNSSTGTLNIEGSINSIAQGFTLTNNGIVNSNNSISSLTAFTNNAGASVNFGKTPAIFEVLGTAAATEGATYRDVNLNVYTIRTTKVNGAVLQLLAETAPIAATPATGTLTRLSGSGDATINYTAVSGITATAISQATIANSGTINTAQGGGLGLSSISGTTFTTTATSVLDPGGSTGKGIMNFARAATTLLGKVALQVSGGTTAGVNYDQIISTTAAGSFDISGATLDVTGIYSPSVYTVIDIIVPNATGTVTGPFASVVGLGSGWSVVYNAGAGGTVQLVNGTPPPPQAFFTWNGTTSSSWTTATNWTKTGGGLSTYPGESSSTDFVIVNSTNAPNPVILTTGNTITVARVTVNNADGALTGAVLTINSGATLNIVSASVSNLLLDGGNIVNNGAINITTTAPGSSGFPVYGIACGNPTVLPTGATEYGISGSGTLNITLSAANLASSSAIVTTGTTSVLPTYKIAMNGTISLNQGSSATISAIRTSGGTTANQLILAGAGFTVGSVGSPSIGSLINIGAGTSVTVDSGTTLTFHSANNYTGSVITGFSSSATATNFTNNGTIDILGASSRSGMGFSTGSSATASVYNISNTGTLNINLSAGTTGHSAFNIGNGGGGIANAGTKVDLTNTGTITLKNTSTAAGTGASIFCVVAAEAPPLNIINSGTLNIEGTSYSFGNKTTLTNTGIVNSNSELRSFTAINNNAGGSINFARTAATATTRQVVFDGLLGTNTSGSLGSTYTGGGNTYVVVSQKFTGSATTLVTNVLSSASIPASGTLTSVSAGATPSVNYTSFSASPINGALSSTTNNVATINTDTASNLSVISGVTAASNGTIAPGGAAGRGIADFANAATALAINSTLSLQIAGNTAAGVDYDQFINSVSLGGFDVSAATLNVTSIYTPSNTTAIDILTTNGGAITGTFIISPALPSRWSVSYATAGKVQLVYTLDIPTFTQVAAICSGGSLSALPTTSSNGFTGTWSPALNNTATTEYTFTPDSGQFATTATMTITVNPSVTPTFTQVAAVCSGGILSALPLTSDNSITGTWSPVLDNTTTTEYTFTPTAGQCATTATMTITVNPIPAAPTGLACYETATFNTSTCLWEVSGVPSKPAAVITNATICSGDTYNWSVNSTNYSTAQTVTITNDICTADQVLNLTITPAPNAGSIGTLSLSASPSDEVLFAALTGADAGGSWARPLSGFVGVYTYTVNATAPCTVNATSTVTVSAASVLPVADTTFNFCTGAKVSALIAATGTGVKVYAALTGGVALLDVALKGTVALPAAYFLSEPTLGGGESARVRVFVRINALPATPSTLVLTNDNAVLPATPATAVTAVGVFVGTNRPLKLTATAVGAVSYIWTIPTGVERTDVTGVSTDNSTTSTDAFIYVKFTVTGVASPLVIGVQSVNAAGCTSAIKASASLTRLLPAAPGAIVMNDGVTTTAIKSFAKYMGSPTVLRLSATAAVTATSYLWELPTGVNRLTALEGGSITTDLTSTDPFIFVNFAGVTNENTDTNLTVTTTLTKVLRLGVKSVNGVGSSVTSNATAVNPTTSSTAKLLTLTAIAPAAPTAVVLNDGSTVTAIKVISKLIGQGGTYRLAAAVPATTLATSFAWELPACVTRVTDLSGSTADNTSTSTDPFIFVKFNGTNPSAGFVYFGVKGVNGIGSSVTNNSLASPATSSTAKLLKLATAVPAAPTAIVLNNGTLTTAITVISKFIGQGGTYRLSAAVPLTTLANSFEWELPSCVTRVTDLSGLTADVTTTSTNPEIFVKFNGTNPAAGFVYFGVKAVNSVGSSVTNNTLASPATSSTAKLLKLATAIPAAPATLVLNDLASTTPTTAVTIVSKYIGTSTRLRLTAGVSVLANTYQWTLPAGVNRVDESDNILTGTSTTDSFIFVNFASAPATSPLVFGVKAVNNVGSSSSVNTGVNSASTDKLLIVTAGLPVKVAAISGSLTVCDRSQGFSYTITAPVGARSYVITAPVGSVVSSATGVSGATPNVLTTSDLAFKVVYDAVPFSTIDKYIAITSVNAFGNSATGFKSAALIKLTDCSTLTGAARIAAKSVTEEFKVLAYPNPSTSEFSLDFTTSSTSKVEMKVYDMSGKLLEVRQMNSEQVNDEKVGNNYPSGVYNVIVTQDANIKTLRVIKQ